MAMVLVALLSGGDYCPQGIARIGERSTLQSALTKGPKIAMGLARAGHFQPLTTYTSDPQAFAQRVSEWQSDLVEELRHDLSGYVGRKNKALAMDLENIAAEDLLSQLPLEEYLSPNVTPPAVRAQTWACLESTDLGRGTLAGVAKACESFFEWGTPDLVVRKFSAKHSLFTAQVVTSALSSQKLKDSAILRIHDVKPSKLDSGHRDVVIDCQWDTYASRCREAMAGSRPDPSTLAREVRLEMGLVEVARQPAQPATGSSRIKIPEYLVRRAWQLALDDYEGRTVLRTAAKARKTQAKPKAVAKSKVPTGSLDITNFMTQIPVPQPSRPRQPIDTGSCRNQGFPIETSTSSSTQSVPRSATPPPLFLPDQNSDSDLDYDSSVVIVAPPVSPSKRNRASASKGDSCPSRSGSPVLKRGVAASLLSDAGSRASSTFAPGSGTKDDPIALSDSSDEEDAPLRCRTNHTPSASASSSTSAPTHGPAPLPRNRSVATGTNTPSVTTAANSSRAKHTRKGTKTKAEHQSIVQLEQTRLSGFFKTQAVSAALPHTKVIKEKYTKIVKDDVEEYHFL